MGTSLNEWNSRCIRWVWRLKPHWLVAQTLFCFPQDRLPHDFYLIPPTRPPRLQIIPQGILDLMPSFPTVCCLLWFCMTCKAIPDPGSKMWESTKWLICSRSMSSSAVLSWGWLSLRGMFTFAWGHFWFLHRKSLLLALSGWWSGALLNFLRCWVTGTSFSLPTLTHQKVLCPKGAELYIYPQLCERTTAEEQDWKADSQRQP